jgi:mediator of RNA polymerase II transcription subunit 4
LYFCDSKQIENRFFFLASEQQILYGKINKLKQSLVESDSDIKSLLLYLKEAEQILASAVYQSKQKLNMIKKAKPLSTDMIIRYAHKISSEYGVCCPENWNHGILLIQIFIFYD